MVSLEQLVDIQVVPPKAAPSISGGTTSPSLSLAVTRGKVSSHLAHTAMQEETSPGQRWANLHRQL